MNLIILIWLTSATETTTKLVPMADATRKDVVKLVILVVSAIYLSL